MSVINTFLTCNKSFIQHSCNMWFFYFSRQYILHYITRTQVDIQQNNNHLPLVSVLLNEVSSCCSISVSIVGGQWAGWGGHQCPGSGLWRGERSKNLGATGCGSRQASSGEKRCKDECAVWSTGYSNLTEYREYTRHGDWQEDWHSRIFIVKRDGRDDGRN